MEKDTQLKKFVQQYSMKVFLWEKKKLLAKAVTEREFNNKIETPPFRGVSVVEYNADEIRNQERKKKK
jgi:hypothetical protein